MERKSTTCLGREAQKGKGLCGRRGKGCAAGECRVLARDKQLCVHAAAAARTLGVIVDFMAIE